jgi:hypothetical protein
MKRIQLFIGVGICLAKTIISTSLSKNAQKVQAFTDFVRCHLLRFLIKKLFNFAVFISFLLPFPLNEIKNVGYQNETKDPFFC